MKKKIKIRDLVTGEVIHEMETDKTGSQLQKVLQGLCRKVDLGRFYIDSSEVDGVG